MERKFRALRFVALVYRILAWIAFIAGALLAIASVVIGVMYARMGAPSELITYIPVLNQVTGEVTGLIYGLMILLASVVMAVFLFAISELVHLSLAIEENTRESAFYLRGEGSVPLPPARTSSWESSGRPLTED
jgi:hypothetical protein